MRFYLARYDTSRQSFTALGHDPSEAVNMLRQLYAGFVSVSRIDPNAGPDPMDPGSIEVYPIWAGFHADGSASGIVTMPYTGTTVATAGRAALGRIPAYAEPVTILPVSDSNPATGIPYGEID
jgi:hypothetical protein